MNAVPRLFLSGFPLAHTYIQTGPPEDRFHPRDSSRRTPVAATEAIVLHTQTQPQPVSCCAANNILLKAWARMMLAGQARTRARRASTTLASAWRMRAAVTSKNQAVANVTILQVCSR